MLVLTALNVWTSTVSVAVVLSTTSAVVPITSGVKAPRERLVKEKIATHAASPTVKTASNPLAQHLELSDSLQCPIGGGGGEEPQEEEVHEN